MARDIVIRPAVEADTGALMQMIDFERHMHRHLDWRVPVDWIGSRPFYVLADGRSILAALACPPEPPAYAWVRLFVASGRVNLQEAWRQLFTRARSDLLSIPGCRAVAAVPLHDWMEDLLSGWSFSSEQNIVVLDWKRRIPLAAPQMPDKISIRPMATADLAQVAEVDRQSFQPLWQICLPGIRCAYQQAAYATVAEDGGRIIGYQISTGSILSAHLARLGVLPDYQRRSVGAALLDDMLRYFRRSGVDMISVNTQSDNRASIALYTKYHFELRSERFPVMVRPLVAPPV